MEVQNQHAPWYYRFKWKIENVSTLEEEDNFSPIFKTGPYKWKLLAFRRGCNVDDYFSVYVVAVDCTNYPRYARFSLAVVIDQTDNAFRKGPGDKMFRFTENESDWGLDDFIRFKELIDPSNGYIVDDACTFEVDLYLKSTQNSIEEGRQLMLCPNYSGKTLSHEKTKKRKKPAKNNSTNVQRKQRGPDRFKQKVGEKPIESCQEAIRDREESVESAEEATQRAAAKGEKVVEGGEILDGKQVVANGKENEKIIEESASSENSDFEKQRAEKTKMALKNKVSTANEASLYKWSPRGPPPPSPQTQPQPPLPAPPPQPTSTTMQHNNNTHAPLSSSSPVGSSYSALMSPNSSTSYRDHHDHHLHQSSLEDFFQAYGVRCYTVAKISELGFTVKTLLEMRDEDLDVMMNNVSQMYRYELLVGERYGIKVAVHAEQRNRSRDDSTTNPLDALSQEGLSEEPVQQEKEVLGSGDALENVPNEKKKKKQQQRGRKGVLRNVVCEDEGGGSGSDGGGGGGGVRHREHPFIVTEPGEVARGKKNGLDCLFHLYEQCRDFLMEVQNIAKEAGEKCPTKVNNQVFRYAKKAGASYINKPKMRHYVHCYALHCLDPEASNALRRAFKERGENVGAWRQACYEPLVKMAALQGDSDIDAIFENHPRLCIWYVPTKLRNLCHAQRQVTASTAAATGSGITSAAVD